MCLFCDRCVEDGVISEGEKERRREGGGWREGGWMDGGGWSTSPLVSASTALEGHHDNTPN